MISYSFCLSLFDLSQSNSNELKVLPCCHKWQDFSLSRGWIVFHCMYINHISFIYSFINRHLGCLCILAIRNNAAIKMEMKIPFQYSVFIYFGYVLRSGISRLYVLFLIFWGTSLLFSIVAGPIYILTMHKKVLFSPHSCQHLLSLVFLIVTILTGLRCYFSMVLVFISLMISDVKHLFMYLLAICVSSLEKCLLSSSTDSLRNSLTHF